MTLYPVLVYTWVLQAYSRLSTTMAITACMQNATTRTISVNLSRDTIQAGRNADWFNTGERGRYTTSSASSSEIVKVCSSQQPCSGDSRL